MRKFIRLCCWQFCLTLVILTGMMTFSRVRSTENMLQAAGFDDCAGSPCFMDIVPQETSLQETIRRLRPYLRPTVLVSQDLSEGIFEVSFAKGRFGALSNGYTETDYVDFEDLQEGFPTLGEFVLFYGEPCYIRVWEFARGVVRTTLFYPGLVITALGSSAGDLRPQQRPESLSLIRVTNVCYSQSSRIEHSDWRGFASIQSYR